MSQFTAGRATVMLGMNSSRFARGAKRVEAGLNRMASRVKTFGLIGGAALVGFAGLSLKLAADAEETASKFDTLFGSAADGARDSLGKFAEAAGRNRFELEKLAADIGALAVPMGFTKDKAADMSVEMVKLATDLGSFNNTSVEDALTAIRSGLVGESEPLRRFGVQLNEARINSEALALGLTKQGEKAKGAAKAEAILSLVMKDTKIAQGDAIRTQGSFTNQMVRFRATLTETATDIGTKLIPIATAVVKKFNDWSPALDSITDRVAEFVQFGVFAFENFTLIVATKLLEWKAKFLGVLDPIQAAIRGITENIVLLFQNSFSSIIDGAENVRLELVDRLAHWMVDTFTDTDASLGQQRTGNNLVDAFNEGLDVKLKPIDFGEKSQSTIDAEADAAYAAERLGDASEAFALRMKEERERAAAERKGQQELAKLQEEKDTILDTLKPEDPGKKKKDAKASFIGVADVFRQIQESTFAASMAKQQLTAARRTAKLSEEQVKTLQKIDEKMEAIKAAAFDPAIGV